MARAAADAARRVVPTLALLAGLAYGVAEILRHRAVPSPPGVPGDSGGSSLAVLALACVVTVVPAFLLAALPWAGRRLPVWATLTAAAVIPASAGSWRLIDRAGLVAADALWHPAAFLVPGFLLAGLAALALLPVVWRWPARGGLPRRVQVGIVAAAAVVLGIQLRAPGPGPGRPGEQPNLLLITIDTLRRDGLGSYGGPSSTALDSLDGVAHEGWSVCSWTQPAVASLMSGTIPTGHGSDSSHGPDPAMAWWPEHVAAAGSRTAAFVTNPYLRRRFGFDRGFGQFDHSEERPWLEPVARTMLAEWAQAWMNARPDSDRADVVVGRALAWLDDTEAAQPWALWVHLLDPHLPYTLRGPGGAPGLEVEPEWMEPLAPVMDPEGFSALHEIRDGSLVPDARQQEALRRLYQTEVDYSAWWSARLIRRAREVSGERDLVWVVTSDHGEEFFEEGGFEHGHSLGDPVLRVPALASGLGDAPRALRLIDLGPAILGALGSGAGFDPAQGTQLLPSDAPLRPWALAAPPEPAACDRPLLLAEGLLYGEPRTRVFLPDGRAFERRDESGEIRPLPGCPEAIGLAIEFDWRALDLWRERRTLSPVGIEVDDELRRQLRALGYVN